MDFLERAAKTSIQRLEQLDREINAQQQQQQQQQQQSNHDAREYSAKRVLPDEQLFLRTNELLEIREAQKRDLERILSKTLLTNDSAVQQTERIDRLNVQISHERALRASIEARTAGNFDDDETSTSGDIDVVQALVHAQKELSMETRLRDERLESLLAVELNRDDAKQKLERLDGQISKEIGTISGANNRNYEAAMPNPTQEELEHVREKVRTRRQTLSEQTRTNTNRVVSLIQEVELEASLNAKADELIQAQIAIERHTSEIATLAMRRAAAASTYSKTSTYDASIDPATSARNLLHFDEQRNVFEHFRMHIAKFIGHQRAGQVVFLFTELDRATLYFARMASGNGKWRMLGFVYIIVVLSYAFLRMLY